MIIVLPKRLYPPRRAFGNPLSAGRFRRPRLLRFAASPNMRLDETIVFVPLK
jgi:hypothetical protein